MKNRFLMLSMIIILFVSCSGKKAKEAEIVAGSTMIASLVKDITREESAVSIMKYKTCPSHFRFDVHKAERYINADMVILYEDQSEIGDVFIKAKPRVRVRTINTADLNVPENYIKAINETAEILQEKYPRRAAFYPRQRTFISDYIRRQVQSEREILDSKKGRVISSEYQKTFCEYLGFNVVAVFRDTEKLSPTELSDVVKKAKGCTYIVADLARMHHGNAKKISKKTGIPIIKFMSYPKEKGKNSWFMNSWKYNMKQLKKRNKK